MMSLPPKIRVDSFAASDTGRVRSENHDQYVVGRLQRSLDVLHSSLPANQQTEYRGSVQNYLFAVVDAVGEGVNGEKAGRVVLVSLVDYLLNSMSWSEASTSAAVAGTQLVSALHLSEIEMQHRAGEGDTPPQAAVTMAYVEWPSLLLTHAGNSRGYVFRDGRLARLTTDHTGETQLAEAGMVTREEEAGFQITRLTDVLSNAMGSGEGSLQPETGRYELQLKDTLLLCTDGLTRHVEEARITEVLRREASAEDCAAQLRDAALENGGTDNITVIVARFEADGEHES